MAAQPNLPRADSLMVWAAFYGGGAGDFPR